MEDTGTGMQLDFWKALADGNPTNAEPGGNPAELRGYMADRLFGDRRNRRRMGARGGREGGDGSPARADRTGDKSVSDG